MKKCPSCTHTCADNAVICPQCGHRFNSELLEANLKNMAQADVVSGCFMMVVAVGLVVFFGYIIVLLISANS